MFVGCDQMTNLTRRMNSLHWQFGFLFLLDARCGFAVRGSQRSLVVVTEVFFLTRSAYAVEKSVCGVQ